MNKEILKYKSKYEDAVKKEGLLLEKIKLQEENQKSMKELSDTLMKNQTEADLQFNKMLEKIKNLITWQTPSTAYATSFPFYPC